MYLVSSHVQEEDCPFVYDESEEGEQSIEILKIGTLIDGPISFGEENSNVISKGEENDGHYQCCQGKIQQGRKVTVPVMMYIPLMLNTNNIIFDDTCMSNHNVGQMFLLPSEFTRGVIVTFINLSSHDIKILYSNRDKYTLVTILSRNKIVKLHYSNVWNKLTY
jgi:hypothetical protein